MFDVHINGRESFHRSEGFDVGLKPSGHPMNTRIAILAILTALSTGTAGAIQRDPGLQDTLSPPISLARLNITISGKPDEWLGLADYDNPFVWLIKVGDDTRMTAMLADPILVNFKPCYKFQTRTSSEKGPLGAGRGQGWYIDKALNGNDAVMSTESSYSGHQSLLLEASVPVSFPPEAYSNPDYNAFLKTANGGKGPAEVEVYQQVKVTPGHQYSMRFQFRSQDYPGGRNTPGHPRGYVLFNSRIQWVAPLPAPIVVSKCSLATHTPPAPSMDPARLVHGL